jgi:hypothetical protein
MRTIMTLLLTLATGSVVLAALADDDPKPAEPGTLVLIDAAGKELKVKSWKFTGGTRRLSWLADDRSDDSMDKDVKGKKGKAAPAGVGPEALIVYEELKAVYLPGVQTLVPIDRLRSITFDAEKKTMTVRAATSGKPEEDVTLVGTTAYKRVNTISLAADVDKGDAGIASLTYQSGGPRGIRGIRFAQPKVSADKPGRGAVVISLNGKEKKTHKVSDLLPLYSMGSGRLKTSPLLLFRKTLRIDVSKIKKIAAGSDDSNDTVWQVVQKDGDDSTLTLLDKGTIDGQQAQLVGLVGKTAAGYKLFPVIAIHAIDFDAGEEAKKDS